MARTKAGGEAYNPAALRFEGQVAFLDTLHPANEPPAVDEAQQAIAAAGT